MKLFGIADNVINFLEKSMKQWKLSLMSHSEDIVDVEVRREIFWGGCHLPHLFFLSMVPLLLMLRKVNASYEWRKKNITESFVFLG